MDKIFGPEMSVALEVPGIADSIKKSESITNPLLDSGYSLANNKINIKPSSLLMGSGITLTNNEIKDMKLINSVKNRNFLERNY